MREYLSFYKTVGGNEGQKCHYATRLDTYGCGCRHDCKYCYAKSLLSFRGHWSAYDPSVANIKKIERKIKSLPSGTIVRLGGMTDCFQPCEEEYGVTYETIKLLNEQGIHYLIVTKSDLIASEKYLSILDKKLAHIQITVTSTDDNIAAQYENACSSSKRIMAIEKLEAFGFDVQLRLSPFIPEYVDLDVIRAVKCRRVLVEFLRVNAFIKKTFDLDYSEYTHHEGGYDHLPLNVKKHLIDKILPYKEVSVCEDSSEAYDYWQKYVNHNPYDCCNLKFDKNDKFIGEIGLIKEKKIAFLSSMKSDDDTRKRVDAWIKTLRPEDVVISGFQSKDEQFVLNRLLDGETRIIMVLAKKLYDKCPRCYEKAVNEGRMLIVAPIDDAIDIVTKENAIKRNQYVLGNADYVVVGHMSHGGKTEEILSTHLKAYEILS